MPSAEAREKGIGKRSLAVSEHPPPAPLFPFLIPSLPGEQYAN